MTHIKKFVSENNSVAFIEEKLFQSIQGISVNKKCIKSVSLPTFLPWLQCRLLYHCMKESFSVTSMKEANTCCSSTWREVVVSQNK